MIVFSLVKDCMCKPVCTCLWVDWDQNSWPYDKILSLYHENCISIFVDHQVKYACTMILSTSRGSGLLIRPVPGTVLATGAVAAWHVSPCVLRAPYPCVPRDKFLRSAMSLRLLTQPEDANASDSLVDPVLTSHLFLPQGDFLNNMVSKY